MANKIYQVPETATTWTDTLSGTLAMTLNNLAAGAGRQGEVLDLGGASARSRWYIWRLVIQFATAPVVGEQVRIHAKVGDGTDYDNDDGTGDIAVSSENKLRNVDHIGTITVDEAATGVPMSRGGLIWLPHRSFMPIVWNATAADNLVASNNVNTFTLQPVPPEIQ